MAIPTLTAANEYHALRGNEDWAGLSDDEKTASLHRAADYIAAFYNLKADVAEDDAVLMNAVTVLALEFSTATPTLKQEPQATSYKDKLGPIEESWTYADGKHDPYPQVTAMMKSILRGTSSGFGAIKLVQ